ncbi:MAG: phage baseplate assembly protein V [Methylobacterium sp.]|uniref:phage baseplate assembly protein V n=1 Tax=Methylobacterium sp. TaxID=409 RepID=UPI0025F695F7|nr:phage baseplate assembly protein V [Methylobacterium sp.]MBX9934561.1 phage baseplate assembly protein V [Methylobacterium sp.]
MDELSELIRREASSPANARSATRIGEVTSYNKETHAVKLKLQPEGIETGWVPLGGIAIGKGFGIAIGAKAGDQMVVSFVDGDHNNPVVISRIFSDQQKPPKVKGGEFAIWHESGTRAVYAEDGSITQTHATGGTVTWDKSGNLTTDNGKKVVATKASTVTTEAGQVTTQASGSIQQQAGKILLNSG